MATGQKAASTCPKPAWGLFAHDHIDDASSSQPKPAGCPNGVASCAMGQTGFALDWCNASRIASRLRCGVANIEEQQICNAAPSITNAK